MIEATIILVVIIIGVNVLTTVSSRVFKGMRMAGRMGGDRVKIQNLEILRVYPDKNLLVVSGSVPGAKGSYVILEK